MQQHNILVWEICLQKAQGKRITKILELFNFSNNNF